MDPSRTALHLLVAKYYQFASIVMLAYDHMLTFGQEVDKIWKRPISFATILFLLNRYGTLMQYIVVATAFNDPDWIGKSYVPLLKCPVDHQLRYVFRCTQYVRFEGVSTTIMHAVGQMIMILRVYAMYGRNRKILSFLLFLWTAQIIVSAIGISTGFAVPLPPGLVGCILTGNSPLFPLIWILPIVTDSFVFLLTLYRTKHKIGRLLAAFRSRDASITDCAATLLLRDGIMYYFLIVLANLMNDLIYFIAETDLRTIGASFSQLLTCTLLSRLVLNLRSLSYDCQGRETGASTTQFGKHVEIMWARTLNDFTETEDACSYTSGIEDITVEEVSLQPSEIMYQGRQNHLAHEV